MNITNNQFDGLSRSQQKVALILSFFSIFLLTNLIGEEIRLYIFLIFSLIFPAYTILTKNSVRQRVFYVYILTFSLAYYSVFSGSTSHLVGFGDSFKHLYESIELHSTGSFVFENKTVSTFSPALYFLYSFLSSVTAIDPIVTTRVISLICFVISILFMSFVFNYLIPSRNLSALLITTFMFISNWGFYRFMSEYRTLNIAFMILSIIIWWYLYNGISSKFSDRILGGIFLTSLVFAHFTTYIFFLLIITSYIFTDILINRDRISKQIIPIAYSLLLFIVFITYFSNGLQNAVITISTQISFILYPSSTGAQTQGLVGLTYGKNLFYTQWVIRISFIFLFIYYVTSISYKRDIDNISVIILSFVLGLSVLFPVLLGSTLSPSRALTFFAIPFAVLFGISYCRLENDISYNKIVILFRFIFIAIIILSVTTTFLKLPQDVSGNTQPIRSEVPSDKLTQPWLSYGGKPAIMQFPSKKLDGYELGNYILEARVKHMEKTNLIYSNGNRYIIYNSY